MDNYLLELFNNESRLLLQRIEDKIPQTTQVSYIPRRFTITIMCVYIYMYILSKI